MMKSDRNVEKVGTLVRTDCCLGIRFIAEDEYGQKNGETNFNIIKVHAKMIPKNPPVFSQKTNTLKHTPYSPGLAHL
jgi:hypothetical protein